MTIELEEFEKYWSGVWVENSMPPILNEGIKELARKTWQASWRASREQGKQENLTVAKAYLGYPVIDLINAIEDLE